MIRIVTRGDDAGCARSANLAMRDAVEEGVLCNISLLAPGPEIEHAAELLKDLKGVNFGLHTCLTSEWDAPLFRPLTAEGAGKAFLDHRGAFHPDGQSVHDEHVPIEIMLEEVEAQLKRLRALGFRVDYLDEHMGIGWMHGYADALQAFAEKHGIIRRPDLTRMPKVEAESGDSHPDIFLKQLHAVEAGTYINVEHPVYPDAEIRAFKARFVTGDELAEDRNQQRLVFMREDILACFKERDIEPIRYSDL